MSEYLLRVEGVNLGAVLDDTAQLSVVRGAGLLLLNAPAELKNAIGKQLEEISVGASAGIFSFQASDDRAAATVAQSATDYLCQHNDYKHFTFVVDWQPLNGDFGHACEALIACNRYRQLTQLDLSLAGLLDSHSSDVCSLDHLRPAGVGSFREKPISDSVYARLQYGQNKRESIYQDLIDDHQDHGFKTTDDLQVLTRFSSAIKAMGLNRNLDHKLALIYIDGNKFGSITSRAATGEELKKWDQFLRKSRSEWLGALVRAISGRKEWQTDSGAHRIEVLMWGGDELMLVVPAWCGLWTLAHFFDHFTGSEYEQTPLTHSAGIVFSQHKTPIKRLKRLACELVDEVKESMPPDGQKNRFAFLTLESIDFPSLSLDRFRQNYYPGFKYPSALPVPSLRGDLPGLAELTADDRLLPRRQLNELVRVGLRSYSPFKREDDPQNREKQESRLKALAPTGYGQAVTQLDGWLAESIPQSEQYPLLRWLLLVELWDYLQPVIRFDDSRGEE